MSLTTQTSKRKTAYVIIYLPGYAGHFLEYALSIAWFAYLHETIPINMFDMAAHGYQHWSEIHHNNDYDVADRIERWLRSDSDVLVTSVHPSEFLYKPTWPQSLRNTEHSQFIVKYLHVRLPDSYSYILNDFKLRNGNFPWLRENELEFDRSIATNIPVTPVRLKNVMNGWAGFKTEVATLGWQLEQPTSFDNRLQEFYQTWFRARKLDQYITADQ